MHFHPTRVNIGTVEINSMGKACKLSTSQTIQIDINNRTKRNEGFENNSDFTIYVNPVQVLTDTDWIDFANILKRRNRGV